MLLWVSRTAYDYLSLCERYARYLNIFKKSDCMMWNLITSYLWTCIMSSRCNFTQLPMEKIRSYSSYHSFCHVAGQNQASHGIIPCCYPCFTLVPQHCTAIIAQNWSNILEEWLISLSLCLILLSCPNNILFLKNMWFLIIVLQAGTWMLQWNYINQCIMYQPSSLQLLKKPE